MRHSQQHAPRVFRLTSSVGDCGTNDPKEVKMVRRLGMTNALDWSSVDKAIRDAFIDTLYQGNVTAKQMVKIMTEGGSRQQIIDYLRNDSNLGSDVRRTNIRVRNLQ